MKDWFDSAIGAGKRRRARRFMASDGRCVLVAVDHAAYMGAGPPLASITACAAGRPDGVLATWHIARRHADALAGIGLVLRVDGGLSASDWAMQFLADILAAPVDRPVVMETTALGAAYLAGRKAGLCPDLPGFAATWRLERRFQPLMDVTVRRRKWAGWQDAVRRTLSAGAPGR